MIGLREDEKVKTTNIKPSVDILRVQWKFRENVFPIYPHLWSGVKPLDHLHLFYLAKHFFAKKTSNLLAKIYHAFFTKFNICAHEIFNEFFRIISPARFNQIYQTFQTTSPQILLFFFKKFVCFFLYKSIELNKLLEVRKV